MICGHVVRAARLVVDVMEINGAECSEDRNRVCRLDISRSRTLTKMGVGQRNMEIIFGYDLDIENLVYMPAELTTAIPQLWADTEFRRTVNEYAWDAVQMDCGAVSVSSPCTVTDGYLLTVCYCPVSSRIFRVLVHRDTRPLIQT